MSKDDTEETSGLRDIFDFSERYDVVLACAFEPEEIGKVSQRGIFNFYDSIGEVIKKIGKRPYLPHKDIDLKWPNEKIYSIPNSIVIPTSDIVLGYLGINSLAAGIMLGSALTNSIPISYIYSDYEDLQRFKVRIIDLPSGVERVEDFGFKREVYDLIEFKDRDECFSKLEASLKKFYK